MKNNFSFGVTPVGNIVQGFTLFALVLFGLCVSPRLWADDWYDITNTNTIYFDNSDSHYDHVSSLIGRDYDYGGVGSVGSQAKPYTKIEHTNLYWRSQEAFSKFNHFLFVKGNWDDNSWNNDKPWDRAKYQGNINTLDNNQNLAGGYHLFKAANSNDDAALSYEYIGNSYTAMNKAQTFVQKLSTDGITYAHSERSIATCNISSYYLDNNNVAQATGANIQSGSNQQQINAVRTATVTLKVSNVNSAYTFVGFYDGDGKQLQSAAVSSSYEYAVSGEKTVYAYFKENMHTVTLTGCTEASVKVGAVTTGTATAQVPTGKYVSSFEPTGGVTGVSAIVNNAVTFNATADGTLTANFAYLQPQVAHSGTASYTVGGAAIRLNPTYTNVADDATYAWTVTSGDAGKITISNPAVANPNISASEAGTYTLQVTVSQGNNLSASQTITLTASASSTPACGSCFPYEGK